MIKTDFRQLRRFHELLMQNAPPGYTPHYFPCGEGKEPDMFAICRRAGKECACGGFWERVYTDKGKSYERCFSCKTKKSNWKAPHARLKLWEASDRLKEGLNVGFGSMSDDASVIIDLDDAELPDVKTPTLSIQSRSRKGRHRVGFTNDPKLKTNIPTDKGEIRSLNEYIVAPGSYVSLLQEDINKLPVEEQEKAGKYTIEADTPANWLTFDDIPDVFKQQNFKPREDKPKISLNLPENCSAIYRLKMRDIIPHHDERFPHPLHASDTGKNFSVSNDGELATCWRHLCTLNPVQFLAVKSGYASCEMAGTPHSKGGQKFQSKLKDDEGLVFYAWRQAKIEGLIPDDDILPTRAMLFLAKKHNWISKDFEGRISALLYNKVLDLCLEVE